MCSVSMIGDHYRDKWLQPTPQYRSPLIIQRPSEISREEFEALRRDVLEMKELLKRAKAYDERNGEPECETDEKMELLRKVAKLVGIDLSDVIGKPMQ